MASEELLKEDVVLIIERQSPLPRSEPRILVMVWSADLDPRFLETQSFRGEAELAAWLEAAGRRWRLNVRWSEKLKGDTALGALVARAMSTAAAPD